MLIGDSVVFIFWCVISIQTSEKGMIAKEQGEDKAKTASDKVIYKIDVPANRCGFMMQMLTVISYHSADDFVR